MPASTPRRVLSVLALPLATLLAVAGPGTPGPAEASPRPQPARSTAPTPSAATLDPAGFYLVTMAAPPAATAPATRPATSQRLQVHAAATQAYARDQLGRQRAAAARAHATISRQLTLATNGFTAALDPAQVTALRKDPAVARVQPVRARRAAVYRTPDTLGLTGATGVWSQVAPAPTAPLTAGQGVVVGVLDTGVWPENPAFRGAAVATSASSTPGTAWSTDGNATVTVPKVGGGTFTGSCTGAVPGQVTEAWQPTLCNQKLVSARAFPTHYPSYAKSPATSTTAPDYWSPRDNDGHGSHTASTAAGADADMGSAYGRSAGIAPGASLAVYKVCWDFAGTDADGDGATDNYCLDDSTVAAVDQAVADGVDVISYSVSGATDEVTDPVSEAFRAADAAGVSVVAAAGNSGSAAGSVNHVAPWVTTVGASAYTAPYAVQGFSGRGPTPVAEGGLLKPDLTAPGAAVVAATVPPDWSPTAAPAWQTQWGTSMATPHVSGLTALLRARHAGDPAWTTSAIRSALMLTARATSTPDPFAQGAGYVNPVDALDPGLLLDVTPEELAGFAATQGTVTGRTPVAATDLNLASIAVARQGGPVTVRRTFRATRPGTWTVSGSLAGYRVTVPASITAAAAGALAPLDVTLQPAGATPGSWAKGTLTLTPTSGPTLHLPLVSRPGFVQPRELRASGRSGRVPLRVASPTAGRFTPTVGLATGVTGTAQVADGAWWTGPTFTVPAGTPHLRVVVDGVPEEDLDLYLQVLDATGTWTDVASSAGTGAHEQVTVSSPTPGSYRYRVAGYAVGSRGTFTHSRYVVTTTPLPAPAVATFTVNPRTSLLQGGLTSTPWAVWNGLEPGRSYLGYVLYPTSVAATTIVITT
ncbi:S8 family serine peptidase [Arsenicicoccus dermatophilus]|uniref:S8 family serine peptidase n=1 Tax=Arsenicicoccus dermatophilus TaxID=1076331 RepID=UPI001F4CA919|nr:S8 family serine peptidase [Arsenicicoccus dermatophilus]